MPAGLGHGSARLPGTEVSERTLTPRPQDPIKCELQQKMTDKITAQR